MLSVAGYHECKKTVSNNSVLSALKSHPLWATWFIQREQNGLFLSLLGRVSQCIHVQFCFGLNSLNFGLFSPSFLDLDCLGPVFQIWFVLAQFARFGLVWPSLLDLVWFSSLSVEIGHLQGYVGSANLFNVLKDSILVCFG